MLNQDAVKDRLRKLFAVAENDASADGEIENALMAAKILMDQHQIEREDVFEADNGEVNTDQVTYGQVKRYSMYTAITPWESYLCRFITTFVPGTGFFVTSGELRRNKHGMAVGKRCTLITFYGPHADVVFCGEIFDEVVTVVAAAARLRYGNALSRGDASAYAEGFGYGLWQANVKQVEQLEQQSRSDSTALVVVNRSLAIKKGGKQWLAKEHGIKLQKGNRRTSRRHVNTNAYSQGKADGAAYKPGTKKRAGYLT